MNDNSPVVTLMSPTSFIAEIMLVLMGLCGISVVGVHLGYFQLLSLLFIGSGVSTGVCTILLSLIGIYVLLYCDYHRLKYYLSVLSLFTVVQLAWIFYLYIFTNNLNTTEQEQASIISLDVCFGLCGSALIALAFHLKQKGSTIEMVKL